MILEQPLWLLLLPVCLALVWWAERGGRALRSLALRSPTLRSPTRRRLARGLRVAAVAALVLALAGLIAERPEDRLTVIFAVDGSRSVGGPGREETGRWLAEAASRLGDGDRAGVVVFGREAMVDAFPAAELRGGEILTRPAAEATDLGAAVRLAGGLFPPAHEQRLVLLSDGVETRGSVAEAVAAASEELDIVWVPLGRADQDEVLVEQVAAPEEVVEGQPHRVRVVVRSSRATGATLRLYRGTVPVASTPIRLEPGQAQVYAFDQVAQGSGAILYRAQVEAPVDGALENNRAAALVRVEGPPSVLLIDRTPGALGPLQQALRGAGMRLDAGGPGALPGDLRTLAAYDAVVLSDVAATHFSEGQLAALATYTRDLGGGLVMIGGPEGFGPGGYWRTPVEEVLPVAMEVKDRSYFPSLGLVLCLDKSGSMTGVGSMAGAGGAQKIEVAKAAAAEVATLLQPMDYLGVVAFDAAAKWVVPMIQGGEPDAVLGQLSTLRAGGGTDAYPAMILASKALAATDARVKHVILLTDGQLAARNHEGQALKMRAKGITISTVGVGTDADYYTLERIARAGGGSFYHAHDIDRVPRIFLRETFKMARSWLVEESFQPVGRIRHPALRGLDAAALPPLDGYVAASQKAGAEHLLVTHRGDPLLSLWRVGLGKSVAFTSDVKGRWSGAWLRSPGYEPFWAALVRWVVGDAAPGRLRASASAADGKLRVTADLLDARGALVGGATLRARVVAPGGEMREVLLAQEGPGRYEGVVDAAEEGPYLAAVVRDGDDDRASPAREGATAAVVVPYADEFRGLSRAPVALERLVAAGRVRKAGDDTGAIFRHRGTGGKVRWPLAPALLAAAAALLVLEVTARKAAVPALFERRRAVAEVAPDARLSSLRSARERAVRPLRPVTVAESPDASQARVTAPEAPASAPAATSDASRHSEEAPKEPQRPAGDSYTSRLLEAKRRLRR